MKSLRLVFLFQIVFTYGVAVASEFLGEKRALSSLMKTIELTLAVPNEKFVYYEGNDIAQVESLYKQRSWFAFSPWRPTSSFFLDLYNQSCVGIETDETFSVHLKVRHVDLWRVLACASGVLLVALGPRLAPKAAFHYATGVSVGVVGSLFLVVFYVSRWMPKKSGVAAVLVGGWGMAMYAAQCAWKSSVSLLKEYQAVVAGYVCVSAVLSFCVVYRLGPVSDRRSLRLVQWALQGAGLALVFFCSQLREATLVAAMVLLANHNFPAAWKAAIKTLWFRRFPPKRCLLTECEYLDESRVETRCALAELRRFCHSPDCDAWKTMSRLKEPRRFAEFVDGSDHLSDSELVSYEGFNSYHASRGRGGGLEDDLLTSDEDEDLLHLTSRK